MHIFLTGITGLTGSAFARAAKRRGHTITAVVHRTPIPDDIAADQILEGDLRNQNWVLQEVLDKFPQVLVNAAAVSSPAACVADPETSQALNVDLPAQLAQLAHHLSARFLHLSSDTVFDGERGNYAPTDEPGPTTLYGWQKLEAEKAVMKNAPDFATVLRLPLLNGNSPAGDRSVHEKLFARWSRGETVRLHEDELRQPCLADNAAEVLVELCEREDFHGIRHWAGAEPVSRWELGQRIIKHFNLPENLVERVSRRDSAEGQNRPADLTLNCTSLKAKLRTQPQSLDEQFAPLIIPHAARKWYHSL